MTFSSLSTRLFQSRLWRSFFRHGWPDNPLDRSLVMTSNIFFHLHPVKVSRKSVKWSYSFGLGVITALLFGVLVFTGVLLMFYYVPSVERAYPTMKEIQLSVPLGQFTRNMHRWSAHLMVLTAILHMARVFYTGAYKPPREFNWIVGVVLLVLTLGASFTGYLLPWDQLAYWAITVGTNIASYAPVAGPAAREMLLGGTEVGQDALIRFYYPNPLHPDPEHRAQVIGHLKQVILAAETMDVSLVNTFMGADGSKHQDANWEEALRVWPDIVAFATDHGRKLTIENCPMLFSYDEWPGGHNLATTPRIWRRILEQWGGAIGLNFDPSHLILQMIDIPRFIREFGPHILHVQAKDLLIDREGLYERGVFSLGMGWQVPRLPGLGDVDWAPLFAALYRAGYDGDVIIEHEDRDFEKTDELIKRGFLLSRDILRPYIK